MKSDVMSRTASASFALAGAQLFAKFIDFFLILLLARLLTPEDFALIAIAMIFVQVTEAILEMPVFQALIRTSRVTRNMLYTAFTISLIRSFIVVAIILILTPVAATLFDESRLYTLMPLLALAPALRGLLNPKLVLFARRLNYYPEAVISIIAKVITALIALPFAIMTKSYWALAMMTVIAPGLLLVASYAYVPFLPKLSLKSWSVFSNMVGWSTVSQFFGAANWQVDVFVLAQFVSRSTTGNFSVAINLSGTVYQIFVGPVLRPFISSFSELSRNGALQAGYLLGTRGVFMLTGPVFTVLAVLSTPIVMLLFGKDWTEAPLFLSVMAFCTLFSVAVQPAGSVAYARDKTFYVALMSGYAFLVKAILIYAGYRTFGIPGFLAGQFAGALAFFSISMWVVQRLIGLSILRQLGVIFVPALALGIMASTMLSLRPFVMYDNQWTLFASIASIAMLGAIAYLAVIFAVWFLNGRPDGVEKQVLQQVAKLSRRHKPA